MKKILIVLFLLLLPLAAEAQWTKTDYLTADDTTTATAATATHLSIAVGAYQKWHVYGVLYVNTDSATGAKIAIDVPTSSTLIGEANGQTTSVTATKYDRISADATLGTAYCTAAASTGAIWYDAYVAVAGTAGNIIIDFATVTSGKVTIKAGTSFTAQRLQ